MIKFAYTILYVPDVGETLSFYEKAFGFKRRFLHESGEYGELETAGVTLAFASRSLAEANIAGKVATTSLPPPMEVALSTDDVEGAVAQAIKAGAQEISSPVEKPWGQTVAYVKDLNGFLVELATPMHAS